MKVKQLNALNGLDKGLHKQWIWNNKENYHKSCDYLQKIGYCIQDLNREIKYLDNPSMKEIVYIIVLVDWICEAVDSLPLLLTKELAKDYRYSKQSEIKMAREYLRALRSFVVAHPLSTNRHSKYGFDGDKICVDVRGKESVVTRLMSRNDDWYTLSFNGLEVNKKDLDADYIMYIYSESKDGMKYFKYVGAKFSDIYRVAEIYIDMLYELDRYTAKQKQKNRKTI